MKTQLSKVQSVQFQEIPIGGHFEFRGRRYLKLALSMACDEDRIGKHLYLSCGEGFIDTIEQNTPDGYKIVARLPTAPGARTSFFSPALDRFYLAVPGRGSQQAEIRVYQPH